MDLNVVSIFSTSRPQLDRRGWQVAQMARVRIAVILRGTRSSSDLRERPWSAVVAAADLARRIGAWHW